MMTSAYNRLTPQELEDLRLCGVTSPEQLKPLSAQRLIHDLQQAREFFPEKTFTLTPERIRELYAGMQAQEEAQDELQARLPGSRSAMPTTGYRRGPESTAQKQTPARSLENQFIMHSPVRCTHPALAFIAACCTLFLLIPLVSIAVFPILMITDNMPQIRVDYLAAIVLGIPCLLYILIARKADCPVCHMRVFRFTHYTRNRAAHHLPLLGYNFATALHIIFFWKYNCPGCGTPVRFRMKKSHRH